MDCSSDSDRRVEGTTPEAPAPAAGPAAPPAAKGEAAATPAAAAAAAKSKAEPEIRTVSGISEALSEAACLDLVFAMDCTGSMGSYIAAAQENVRGIMQSIVAAEKADVRFSVIGYRDHPPQDSSWVTKVFEFTPSLKTIRGNLATLSASGGGDGPEAVADALHAALKLDWRGDATKICILISDAPPHGIGSHGDGFPNGCPLGLDPLKVARDLATLGVSIYTVGCEPSINQSKPFFEALCHITGGQYVPLGSASVMADVVIGGAREEIALSRVMAENQAEFSDVDGSVDEDAYAARVWSVLKARKVQTNQLQAEGSGAALKQASPFAQRISKSACLADVRKQMGAAGAPARKSRARGGRGGGGLFSSLRRSRRKESKAASGGWVGAGADASLYSAPAAGGAAMAADEMPSSCYASAVADVTVEQCARLVRKTKAKKGFY